VGAAGPRRIALPTLLIALSACLLGPLIRTVEDPVACIHPPIHFVPPTETPVAARSRTRYKKGKGDMSWLDELTETEEEEEEEEGEEEEEEAEVADEEAAEEEETQDASPKELPPSPPKGTAILHPRPAHARPPRPQPRRQAADAVVPSGIFQSAIAALYAMYAWILMSLGLSSKAPPIQTTAPTRKRVVPGNTTSRPGPRSSNGPPGSRVKITAFRKQKEHGAKKFIKP